MHSVIPAIPINAHFPWKASKPKKLITKSLTPSYLLAVFSPTPLTQGDKDVRISKRASTEIALLAEPDAKANSFVGTEEYLAPEIIKGQGHGAEVDW